MQDRPGDRKSDHTSRAAGGVLSVLQPCAYCPSPKPPIPPCSPSPSSYSISLPPFPLPTPPSFPWQAAGPVVPKQPSPHPQEGEGELTQQQQQQAEDGGDGEQPGTGGGGMRQYTIIVHTSDIKGAGEGLTQFIWGGWCGEWGFQFYGWGSCVVDEGCA